MLLDRATLQAHLDLALGDVQNITQGAQQTAENIRQLQIAFEQQQGALQYAQLHVERLRKQLAELAAETHKAATTPPSQ